MKSKEEIIKTAQKVMADISWTFDKDSPPVAIYTSKEEIQEKWKDFKGFEEIKDRIRSEWMVCFEFPVEDKWEGRNTIFLKIYDDTGEPFEIFHKQAKFKITKNHKGVYIKGVNM